MIWQSEREKGQSFPVERLKVNRKCLSFVNDEKSFYLWNNKAYFVLTLIWLLWDITTIGSFLSSSVYSQIICRNNCIRSGDEILKEQVDKKVLEDLEKVLYGILAD